MRPQRNLRVAGACLALLSLWVICDTAAARPPARGVRIMPGPPAHAPAYGLRRKQVCGFELVFDVGVGLYVAVGMTDVYYHEGYFYRLHAGVWEISLRGVTWEPVVMDKLPPGLQIKAKAMAKPGGNGNAAGNAAKSNGAANAGAAKPSGAPGAGAAPSANGAKAGSTAAGTVSQPAGAADNSANKPAGSANAIASRPSGTADGKGGKSGSNTGGSVSKPTGSADSSASKPNASPDANRKAKPAGKGRGK